MNQKLIDQYVGKQYGDLTITSLHKYRADGDYYKPVRLYAMCECSCGGVSFTPVCNLKSGHAKSCGCKHSENAHSIIHGHRTGGKPSPTYTSWTKMIQRCTNPHEENYYRYGGAGITVCESWRDNFVNFLNDMGERLEGTTIDRIDPYGNYEPSNCRWATPKEQKANQRK